MSQAGIQAVPWVQSHSLIQHNQATLATEGSYQGLPLDFPPQFDAHSADEANPVISINEALKIGQKLGNLNLDDQLQRLKNTQSRVQQSNFEPLTPHNLTTLANPLQGQLSHFTTIDLPKQKKHKREMSSSHSVIKTYRDKAINPIRRTPEQLNSSKNASSLRQADHDMISTQKVNEIHNVNIIKKFKAINWRNAHPSRVSPSVINLNKQLFQTIPNFRRQILTSNYNSEASVLNTGKLREARPEKQRYLPLRPTRNKPMKTQVGWHKAYQSNDEVNRSSDTRDRTKTKLEDIINAKKINLKSSTHRLEHKHFVMRPLQSKEAKSSKQGAQDSGVFT